MVRQKAKKHNLLREALGQLALLAFGVFGDELSSSLLLLDGVSRGIDSLGKPSTVEILVSEPLLREVQQTGR